MTKPYFNDLRQRAVNAVVSGGNDKGRSRALWRFPFQRIRFDTRSAGNQALTSI